jgi:hypothetical protein
MNNILPIDAESSVLAKLRKIYGPAANIQQGYIRLEKVLTQSSTSENFTLGEGRSNGNKRPLENFLSQSDNFVPVYMRVGIQKEFYTELGNNGNEPVYSYPDLQVFSGVGVSPALSEAQALEGIYSGNLGLKSNTYEVVNRMSLERFRRVPQTQTGSDANTTAPAVKKLQASSGEIFEGFVKLPIVPIFEGKKRNEFNFTFAQGADATNIGYTDVEEDRNILVFTLWGFLVRNASEPASVSELTRNGVIL